MKTVEQLKIALKCGEYDGVDLMQSWCTMENQQKQIAELTHALNELYEVVDEFYYNDFTGVRPEIEEALEKADKVLEGN